MALFNLSSAQLARLIKLVKTKESLQAQMDRVEAELGSMESGSPTGAKRGRKPGRPPGSAKLGRPPGSAKLGRPPGSGKVGRKPGRKRGKRLKEPLLKALSAAGSAGMTVKDLAAHLKVKPGNVFSWFYTTGKTVKGIKKVGEAKYALGT